MPEERELEMGYRTIYTLLFDSSGFERVGA